MAYVIQYLGSPPCWIAVRNENVPPAAFDVTFQRSRAQRFISVEEARKEMIRMDLSASWSVANVGDRPEPEPEPEPQ